MRNKRKKIMNVITKSAFIITLSLIIGIILTMIFISESEKVQNFNSFLGGAISGVIGFISAFLITEQNKHIEEEKNKKDVLEQVKYIILNIDKELKHIDSCTKSGKTYLRFRQYQIYPDRIKEMAEYKISPNLQGLLNLNDYIYDKEWGPKLSSIEDFNDKRMLLDFMRKIELVTSNKDKPIEVFALYKEVVSVIEVLIKYGIYDQSFENFAHKDTTWTSKIRIDNDFKIKLKAIYNRFNLNELECREISIKIDKNLIRTAKKELDKREKELDKREKELDKREKELDKRIL